MHLSRKTIEALVRFVPEEDLAAMRVLQSVPWRWFPAALGMGAATFDRWVIFRQGQYRPDTPLGLGLIAHEAHHITQRREMGLPGFLGRYLLGQLKCRFDHDRHPLEAPAIELQRKVTQALGGPGVMPGTRRRWR